MDYKLAKKLKDAGFPQGKECDEKGFCSNGGSWWPEGADKMSVKEQVGIDDFNWKKENYIYIPILEELIELCGDGIVLWKYNNNWFAGIIDSGIGSVSDLYIDDYPNPLEKGKTTEIAVAELWLVLNKK